MKPTRAVITGASLGIGRALSLELARRGVRDLVLVARNLPPLEQAAAELEALGVVTKRLALDVADTDALVSALRAEDDHRRIDLVVANAGVGAGGTNHLAWETWSSALATNFLGAAATLGALADRMATRHAGHLVSISSLSSIAALPRSIAYCVPKAGMNMLADCMRLDLGSSGVAVTNVYLGFVETRMVARSTHPMPQLMSPQAAAQGIATAIERRANELILPRGLGLSVLALRGIPRPIRERLLRALDRVAG